MSEFFNNFSKTNFMLLIKNYSDGITQSLIDAFEQQDIEKALYVAYKLFISVFSAVIFSKDEKHRDKMIEELLEIIKNGIGENLEKLEKFYESYSKEKM